MKLKEIMLTDKKFTGSYVKGFKSIFSTFKIIVEHKGLLKFFIIPFVLNVILLSSIFYFSYITLEPWLSGMLAGNEWYIEMLRFIIKPLLIIIMGIVAIFVYSIVGSIVTAPFNDYLSAGVEKRITGIDFNEKFSFSEFFSDITRIALNIVKLLLILLCVNLVLFLLNFIPVAGNILFSVISFFTTTFFMGFQFFDFPLERRKFVFGDKLKIAWKNKSMIMGLGTGFLLISLIPIVGFLGLNFATIGAATLFIDHIKPALKLDKDGTNNGE